VNRTPRAGVDHLQGPGEEWVWSGAFGTGGFSWLTHSAGQLAGLGSANSPLDRPEPNHVPTPSPLNSELGLQTAAMLDIDLTSA
jgi:hypothetical protein